MNNRQFKEVEFGGICSPYYYVDYNTNGPHFKQNAVTKSPYLWTKHISYCVVIGLYVLKDGKTEKIGLYHSVSEHANSQNSISKNITESLKSFLKDTDPKDMHIVIGFNKQCVTSDSMKSDEELFRKLLNACCEDLQLPAIPDENYHTYQGKDTFYITADGFYGSLQREAQKAILDIQEFYLNFLEAHSSNKTIDTIFNSISSHANQEFNDLKTIKRTAAATLLNQQDIPFEEEMLYLKTIAWDPILGTTSEVLLKEWLDVNKNYQLSEQARDIFFEDISGDEFYESNGEYSSSSESGKSEKPSLKSPS